MLRWKDNFPRSKIVHRQKLISSISAFFFYRAILSFGSCRLINWLVPFDRLARATLFSGSGDYIPKVGAFSSQCGNKTFPRWELLFQRRASLLFSKVRLLLSRGRLLQNKRALLKLQIKPDKMIGDYRSKDGLQTKNRAIVLKFLFLCLSLQSLEFYD